VTVYDLFDEEQTRCRRSDLTCNGTKICEFFDRSLLDGYIRYEANDEDMRSIFSSELNANEREFRAPDAIMARQVFSRINNLLIRHLI
jgi:hypothetical protein